MEKMISITKQRYEELLETEKILNTIKYYGDVSWEDYKFIIGKSEEEEEGE